MQKLLIATLFVFLIVAGCVSSSGNTSNDTGNGGTGGVTAVGATKEFTISAKQFEFSPATITVNKGDTVIIHATSTDVQHGIAIPAFGVNQTLPAGQTVTFQFLADQSGSFPFFCNVFCGAGHRDMTGTLVVK